MHNAAHRGQSRRGTFEPRRQQLRDLVTQAPCEQRRTAGAESYDQVAAPHRRWQMKIGVSGCIRNVYQRTRGPAGGGGARIHLARIGGCEEQTEAGSIRIFKVPLPPLEAVPGDERLHLRSGVRGDYDRAAARLDDRLAAARSHSAGANNQYREAGKVYEHRQAHRNPPPCSMLIRKIM